MVVKVRYTSLFYKHDTNIRVLIAQEEREYAIQSFKDYKKDVLVATDVASKGLDFPEIKHVINFDMPKEIEDYGKHRHYKPFIQSNTHTLYSASYWSYWS
jgi:superfamily II DNA helicase RecQ